MRDPESLTKRQPRAITRLMKYSGALVAQSLGDVVCDKKDGKFEKLPWNCHDHSWIPGTDIEVCTKCGMTRAKAASGPAKPTF